MIEIHNTLHLILTHPSADLTSCEVAEVLAVSKQTVTEAIRLGRLEAVRYNLKGRGEQWRYRVAKAALVKWLWEHTTGDRALLREALAARAPGLLAMLEAPRNLVPFENPKPEIRSPKLARRRADPHGGHPDLFAADG